METNFVELQFHGIHTMEPDGFTCAVFRWEDGNKVLPIWMDQDDALRIQAYHSGYRPRRPGVHELLADAFTRNGPWVSNLRIVSHFEGVFMASVITSEGEELDARPSDILMLSELLELPIAADEEILQQCAVFVNQDDMEAYFGIMIEAADDEVFTGESASGDAQADADFEQLMQSLGVTEDDLFIDTDPDDDGGDNPGR